jgi:tetratricopeptide (TPR) repeat protein
MLNLGLVLLGRGALAEAEALERRALGEFSVNGDQRNQASTRAALAQILTAAGRLAEAEHEARVAVALAATLEPMQALALAALSRVLGAAGRHAEALETSRRAAGIVERLGGLDEGDALVRLAHAEALHGIGDHAAATAAIEQAHERTLHRARPLDPERRERFLAHGPYVARTRELWLLWR